jgi:hypothetical protein
MVSHWRCFSPVLTAALASIVTAPPDAWHARRRWLDMSAVPGNKLEELVPCSSFNDMAAAQESSICRWSKLGGEQPAERLACAQASALALSVREFNARRHSLTKITAVDTTAPHHARLPAGSE